ncbi:MAG: endolytic transglycosylase MltG [Alphaproteobacteria bacterium]
MLRFLFRLSVLCIAAVLFVVWGLFAPTNITQPITIVIPRQTSCLKIAQALEDSGAVPSRYPFAALAFITGKYRTLKAGEYLLAQGISPHEIMLMMAEGRVVRHAITIPEGYTVAQAVKLLQEIPILKGSITEVPPEGHLLPATYEYIHGDQRQQLLTTMQTKMETLLQSIWQSRDEGLPLQTPGEALILASIVEKESGVQHERPRIASVFINRLRLKMPLQSDPTVIYGLTLGKADLGRDLTFKDLQHHTAHNTYTINALPPTPIACPGKEALLAVLHPHSTRDIYFVADGTGQHDFSDNYAEHTIKVKRLHRLKRKHVKK